MSPAKAGFAAAGRRSPVRGRRDRRGASDYLLKRGVALSTARKTVILIGLVISCAILLCITPTARR
jgi:hypothetical protein